MAVTPPKIGRLKKKSDPEIKCIPSKLLQLVIPDTRDSSLLMLPNTLEGSKYAHFSNSGPS